MSWIKKYEGKYINLENSDARDLHNDLAQEYSENFKSVTSYFPPSYKADAPSYIEVEFEAEPEALSPCDTLVNQYGLDQE